MSHYIQDNQAVIKTLDGCYILLTKGGDNNVSSASSNRRCTSWSFMYAFESIKDYNDFLNDIMVGDIAGGSWQFNSLKNKTFIGYSEYEDTIYKRFEKAIKSAIEVSFDLTELNEDNIHVLEKQMNKGLIDKGFSMNDEDGNHQYFNIAKWSSEPKKDAMRYLSKKYKGRKENANGYREFCKKYSNISIMEAFKSVEFCEELNRMDIDYRGIYSLESKKTYPISSEGFLALFKNRPNRLLEMYDYKQNTLFENYPHHVYLLLKTTDILTQMQSRIDELSDDERKYSEKRYVNALNKCIEFVETKHIEYKEAKIEKLKTNHLEFIKIWNRLEVRSWYVQTGRYIPDDIEDLKHLINTGYFSLDDIKEECNDTFSQLIHHHLNQKEKNKKAVELLAKELITEYSVLLREKTIDRLCDYFKIAKPKKEEVVSVVSETILIRNEPKVIVEAHTRGCLF